MMTATVVDASCTPSGSDVTGQVSAGYVILSGRLVKALIHWSEYSEDRHGTTTLGDNNRWGALEVVFDMKVEIPLATGKDFYYLSIALGWALASATI
jgi:hypothetical protein